MGGPRKTGPFGGLLVWDVKNLSGRFAGEKGVGEGWRRGGRLAAWRGIVPCSSNNNKKLIEGEKYIKIINEGDGEEGK